MSTDTSVRTAVVSADAGTLALIQKLVDEKRRALEAAQTAAPVGGGSCGCSGLDPAAPATMQDIPNMDVTADESCAGASKADSDSQSVSSSTLNLHRSSEMAQLRAMRLQQEMLLREAEQCTFHPQINSGRSSLKVDNPEAFFNRAQQWQDDVNLANEERRRKQEERQMAHCTFTPRVTPRGHTKPVSSSSSSSALREKNVVNRLYQPQERMAKHEAMDRLREERRQEEEAECSFQPQTNKPLRTNVATNVSSRYRRPSPAKRVPLPTGEEHCTFSPAVNRTPRALSGAVAEYLDDPAHLRLSRQPPSPRPSLDGTPGGTARTLKRSSSAPRMREAAGSEIDSAGGSASGSAAGEEVFASFLERQAAYLHRKKVSEAKRAEALAAERAAMVSVGSQSSRRASVATPRKAGGEADGGDSLTSQSFLERVAEASERKKQLSSTHERRYPSDQADECTFQPRITQSARSRRGRSVEELSVGDLQRRMRTYESRRKEAEEKKEEALTFRPATKEVPGVQSRLKVASEPGSYLARVRQHMKLKEQLTACVREAQESQQLAECTFHPQTHEAPAYITRIAKSVRMAKSAQPPAPPAKPEWR